MPHVPACNRCRMAKHAFGNEMTVADEIHGWSQVARCYQRRQKDHYDSRPDGWHQTAYSGSYNQPNPKIPAADPTKVAMNREDY